MYPFSRNSNLFALIYRFTQKEASLHKKITVLKISEKDQEITCSGVRFQEIERPIKRIRLLVNSYLCLLFSIIDEALSVICSYLLLFLRFCNFRSGRPQVFFKIGALKNFAKFTGKRLYQSLFFMKSFFTEEHRWRRP